MLYDCFSFFNELDLLEIRLNVLNDVVDKFVLVEARKTHTNRDKPLYFQENKARFSAFGDKIIHIVVDDFPEGSTNWERENIQRNAIERGLDQANDDDVILISDLDEIPRSELVAQEMNKPGIKRFLLDMFYFYVNYKNYARPVWDQGTILISYKDFLNPATYKDVVRGVNCPESINGDRSATYARYLPNVKKVRNGGWHFSYLGDVDAFIVKVNSIAEGSSDMIVKREDVVKRISNGLDFIVAGRTNFGIQIPASFPKYLRENQSRYSHLIFPVTAEYLRETRRARSIATTKRFISRLFGGIRHLCRYCLPKSLRSLAWNLYLRVCNKGQD